MQCVQGIGASSIPGAISKGDLDVFVGVARCRFDKSILLLGEIGFSEKQDTLRTPSLCMLESREYSYYVAVQLVENAPNSRANRRAEIPLRATTSIYIV